MCRDMGGYRCVGTWEGADVCVHGRIQMCENIGGCRCGRAWDYADV